MRNMWVKSDKCFVWVVSDYITKPLIQINLLVPSLSLCQVDKLIAVLRGFPFLVLIPYNKLFEYLKWFEYGRDHSWEVKFAKMQNNVLWIRICEILISQMHNNMLWIKSLQSIFRCIQIHTISDVWSRFSSKTANPSSLALSFHYHTCYLAPCGLLEFLCMTLPFFLVLSFQKFYNWQFHSLSMSAVKST